MRFKDGTAWLQGQVRDLHQENVALNLALEPDGVDRVINNLTIASIAPTAPVPSSAPVAATVPPPTPDDLIPIKQTSGSEPAPVKQAQEAVSPPEESLPQGQPERSRSRARVSRGLPPSRRSRCWRFLIVARRRAGTLRLCRRKRRPASRTPARRVPASFASAPAQRVAATETITEPAPQPMVAAVPPQPMATAAPRPMPMSVMQNATPRVSGCLAVRCPWRCLGLAGAVAPTRFDQPNMPNHAWPSYASYPNYAAVTYPRQYSATAWPYIGPFYPYPQVPLGWRKVTLQWDDGWWMLDFKDEPGCCWWR